MLRIFAVILLLFASVTLSSCFLPTSSTTVKGRIVHQGKPVPDAQVKFGGTMAEVTTKTGPDGKFTLTARHRPTQMLTISVEKPGLAQREELKFPGFAAPGEEIEVEMLTVIGRTR